MKVISYGVSIEIRNNKNLRTSKRIIRICHSDLTAHEYGAIQFHKYSTAGKLLKIRSRINFQKQYSVFIRENILLLKMTLYSFVQLKNSTTYLVLKTTWCDGMNSANAKYYGGKSTKQRKIFYSPIDTAEPDFSMNVRSTFYAIKAACYTGYVKKTFGT